MLKRSAVPSLLHTADPARNGFVVVRENKGRSLSAGRSFPPKPPTDVDAIAARKDKGRAFSEGGSALSSNRDSLSEQEAPQISRMSPALAHRFELGLAVVSNPKIKGLFQENLQKVLCDQGLPEFIKHLLVDKMGAMERILGSMASREPSTLLLGTNGISHFAQYADASRDLKVNLIQHKDTAGVTFSGRSLKLFSWCQAELKETVHPVVHYLLEKLSERARLDAESKFSRLADISNLLILQIACGDDIADNIQNGVLVPVFVDIPICDDIRIQKGIKTREESRTLVEAHNNGIYLAYYDVAVTIWDDIIAQLKKLFGDAAWSAMESGFLSVHEKVMGSLTYSILMNTEPHNPEITEASIMTKLAPNMMVECFRFLEKELVQKLALENGVSLPDAEDIIICDLLVSQSQTSASLANATATAAREMRENDISNPIPFALNKMYMESLRGASQELGDVFEVFLQKNGYRNHFFAQYECDEDKAPLGFDCLDLQLLRKVAMRRVMETLGALRSRGLTIAEDDYSLACLAVNTLQNITDSRNELDHRDGKTLKKLTTHIQLIDQFFDDILAETKVEEHLFQKWAEDVSKMNTDAEAISDVSLRAHAKTYVSSWEDFLCMYLLFKRAFDGTI